MALTLSFEYLNFKLSRTQKTTLPAKDSFTFVFFFLYYNRLFVLTIYIDHVDT